MIDTLRADELGCYGARVTQTPELDRFAADATLFESATAVAPATRPSVASFMTGVSPLIHGAVDLQSPLPRNIDRLKRLPDLLRRAGYQTAGIVANPNVSSMFGFREGFNVYRELYDRRSGSSAPRSTDLVSTADMVVSQIERHLDAIAHDKPFFLFVLSVDPHAPYTPPAPFDAMYDPQAAGATDGTMPALTRFDLAVSTGEALSADRIRALYRGEVSYADRVFGQLLDSLRKRGMIDETLVVFTADHGEEFLEHGRRGHGQCLYEEVIHIPMILRLPGQFAAGRRRNEAIDTLDLSASLLRIAEVEPPEYWPGRDLRGELRARPVFSTSRAKGFSGACVRFEGLKMIRDETAGWTRYFDLHADAAERTALQGEAMNSARRLLSEKLDHYFAYTESVRGRIMVETEVFQVKDLPEDVLKSLKALGYVE